ncbi:MAG: hypothetical protein AAFV53_33985 [Myxococcota bacterium]
MSVTVEQIEEHYCLHNTPYDARLILKNAGCVWNRSLSCWRTEDPSIVDDVLSLLATESVSDLDPLYQKVYGEVFYEGEHHYWTRCQQRRQQPGRIELLTADGLERFWVDDDDPDLGEIIFFYPPRTIRGLIDEETTEEMKQRAEGGELFAGVRYIPRDAQQLFDDGQVVTLLGLRYRIVHQHAELHRIFNSAAGYRWETLLCYWAELIEPGLTDPQRRRILALARAGREEAAQAVELVRALQIDL